MATSKKSKSENKGTGFAGPTIGNIVPKGSTIKHLSNGRIKIVPPKTKGNKK